MKIIIKDISHFIRVCKSIITYRSHVHDLNYRIGKDIGYIFLKGLHNPKLSPISKPEGSTSRMRTYINIYHLTQNCINADVTEVHFNWVENFFMERMKKGLSAYEVIGYLKE